MLSALAALKCGGSMQDEKYFFQVVVQLSLKHLAFFMYWKMYCHMQQLSALGPNYHELQLQLLLDVIQSHLAILLLSSDVTHHYQ